MNKITRSEAAYTGGGIYIYTGQLDDGRFFLSADDWEDFVYIMDADPNADWENICYQEWQEAHTVETLCGKTAFMFWRDLLKTVDMLDYDRENRLWQLNADYPQYAD